MTDEQRHDSLRCLGNEVLQTPHLDELAKYSTTFTHTFCASPICVPSRVSFYTGQYVNRNGAVSNAPDSHITLGQTSLVEVLKEQGYTIGLAGKNHTFSEDYMDRWFDYREEYFHFGKTHGTFTDSDRAVVDYLKDKSLEGLIDGPVPFDESEWINQRIADDGIRFLESNTENPFFLYYSFPDPHWPNVVCEPYYSMYDGVGPEDLEVMEMNWEGHPFKHFVQSQVNGFDTYTPEQRARILATYYGQISSMDAAVGRLMEKLRELSMLEDTMIVYTADHGNFGGRYGLLGKTGGFFDALVRIPMMVHVPGQVTASTSDAEINNIDVAPTILESLKIEIPSRMQGVSFLPVLEGKSDTHRSEIYSEVGAPDLPPDPVAHRDFAQLHTQMSKDRGWQWFCDYVGKGRAAMLRKDGWKYCRYVNDLEELYDLTADPMEINNLAEHPDSQPKKEELRERLFDWLMTVPVLKNGTVTSAERQRLFF